MAKLDLDDYLPYLLNRAGAKIADAFGKVARQHGISLQMWRVLAALHQQDGQSVGSLASHTSIDISTLSRLLDQMQKKRLLLRRRDGADQRSITIHRAAAALAITEKLIPVALAYESKALAGLTRSEEKSLKALLRRVYENLDGLKDEPPTKKSRAAETARLSSKSRNQSVAKQ
jgi:DNA-binding MarR family transcriptional regulator